MFALTGVDHPGEADGDAGGSPGGDAATPEPADVDPDIPVELTPKTSSVEAFSRLAGKIADASPTTSGGRTQDERARGRIVARARDQVRFNAEAPLTRAAAWA